MLSSLALTECSRIEPFGRLNVDGKKLLLNCTDTHLAFKFNLNVQIACSKTLIHLFPFDNETHKIT